MIDLQSHDSTQIKILPILHFWNIPNYVENKVQYIKNRAQKIIGKSLPYSMKNFQKRRIATYVHQCLTNNVCKNFENYFEVIEGKIILETAELLYDYQK